MNDEICLLLVILTEEFELVRVAIKLAKDSIHYGSAGYYKEQATQAGLQRILPTHYKELGKVVEVIEIFDVWDSTTLVTN